MISEKEFLENSRFKKVDKIVEKGKTYFPLLGELEISIDNPMDVIKWKHGMNFRLLAYKYYGSSKLWWVIAYANKIDNPFLEVELDTSIYIPNRSAIPNL